MYTLISELPTYLPATRRRFQLKQRCLLLRHLSSPVANYVQNDTDVLYSTYPSINNFKVQRVSATGTAGCALGSGHRSGLMEFRSVEGAHPPRSVYVCASRRQHLRPRRKAMCSNIQTKKMQSVSMNWGENLIFLMRITRADSRNMDAPGGGGGGWDFVLF